jgi:hypothetical protein
MSAGEVSLIVTIVVAAVGGTWALRSSIEKLKDAIMARLENHEGRLINLEKSWPSRAKRK